MVHHIAYAQETLHFMGASAWIKSTSHLVIDGWAQYCWTKSNRVAQLHDMERKLVLGNSKKG